MVIGIGIDIIEVARIQASHERFGERFLKRILLASEIEYCLSNRVPAPFLAARFAAKEAISKAFGTGIGSQLGWLDMEICRRSSGEPFVVFHGAGRELLEARKGKAVLVSLSHTQIYATAVAVIESVTPPRDPNEMSSYQALPPFPWGEKGVNPLAPL